MKINNIPDNVISIKKFKKKNNVSGNFSLSAPDEEIVETEGVSEISSINSLLILQELNEGGNYSKEVKHGYKILDELKKLQLSIISGDVAKENLEILQKMVNKTKKLVEDQELTRILEEIEIRAEIELAKISKLSQDKKK